MKKRPLFNFQELTVKRISTSPYFKESFAKLEKETIEQKAGTKVLPFNSGEPADILITNTHTITKEISDEDMSRCKLLIHPNSGHDNLEVDFVARAPFPIIVGNPIRAHAVTNFILSSLFAHYSPVPQQSSWDEARTWKRKLLSELSVVVLGHGHIGSLLEKSLRPLVSRLQIFDPYVLKNDLDLNDVDVVIPACSLNIKNYHMINADFLKKLNSDFLLINAARGALVKTSALIEVLQQRPQAFAVIDVFENEPADFTIFKDVKNVALTSHIAGVYSSIDQKTANYVADVIYDFKTLNENLFRDKYKTVLLQNKLMNGMLV